MLLLKAAVILLIIQLCSNASTVPALDDNTPTTMSYQDIESNLDVTTDVTLPVTTTSSPDNEPPTQSPTTATSTSSTTPSTVGTSHGDVLPPQPSPSPIEDDSGSNSKTVLIAVLVVAIFFLMALIVGLLVVIFLRRSNPGPPGKIPRQDEKVANSIPVSKADFDDYLACGKANSGLEFMHQFDELRKVGIHQSKNAANERWNQSKNRFIDILPYDHSRVHLLAYPDVPGFDYINANYIPGYNSKREYIATQGPLESTTDDFWTMIWLYEVSYIVMVTKCQEGLVTKCYHYWPQDDEPQYYGDYVVRITSQEVYTDWTITVMDISMGPVHRSVVHYNFTSWPDRGVPVKFSPLVEYVKMVRRNVTDKTGPIVVHCSAGVGRSGTFITLDTLLQHIKTHDTINIYNIVYRMRKNRICMVQTEVQYIWIHNAMSLILNDKLQEADAAIDARQLQQTTSFSSQRPYHPQPHPLRGSSVTMSEEGDSMSDDSDAEQSDTSSEQDDDSKLNSTRTSVRSDLLRVNQPKRTSSSISSGSSGNQRPTTLNLSSANSSRHPSIREHDDPQNKQVSHISESQEALNFRMMRNEVVLSQDPTQGRKPLPKKGEKPEIRAKPKFWNKRNSRSIDKKDSRSSKPFSNAKGTPPPNRGRHSRPYSGDSGTPPAHNRHSRPRSGAPGTPPNHNRHSRPYSGAPDTPNNRNHSSHTNRDSYRQSGAVGSSTSLHRNENGGLVQSHGSDLATATNSRPNSRYGTLTGAHDNKGYARDIPPV